MTRYISLIAAVALMAGSFALSCKGGDKTADTSTDAGRLNKETFISIQSEVGCAQAQKGSLTAAAVYAKRGITPEELETFAKSLNTQEQVEVSREIAKRMAACLQGKRK